MKQIVKTPDIIARFSRAVGSDLSIDSVAIFEAIALNTRPLRKRHPLYNKAVVERSMLLEMAARLDQESVPLQIMHDGETLPIGRAFYGEIVEKPGEAELRVLFFVDKTHTDVVAKIDNGTVDQVSVGAVSKKLTCSSCGFDYFGADATFEHIFTGTCDQGHKLGSDGVYARMVGLDQWFELSLVGMGGAQNARIVNAENSHFSENLQRLAASGAALDQLILTATAETDEDIMNMQEFVAQLTATTTELATVKVELAAATSKVTALTTERDELQARIAEAGDVTAALAAKDTQIATAEAATAETAAKLEVADAALRDVLTKVLTASGKAGEQLPESLDDVVAQISEQAEALTAALSAGGKSKSADEPGRETKLGVSSAFRVK